MQNLEDFMGIVDKHSDDEIHAESLRAAFSRTKPNEEEFEWRFPYLIIEICTMILEDDAPLSAEAYEVLSELKKIAVSRMSFLYHQECQQNKKPDDGDYEKYVNEPNPVRATRA